MALETSFMNKSLLKLTFSNILIVWFRLSVIMLLLCKYKKQPWNSEEYLHYFNSYRHFSFSRWPCYLLHCESNFFQRFVYNTFTGIRYKYSVFV